MSGEHRLERLSIQRAGVQFARIARELLSDRAPTLLRLARAYVGNQRPQHALEINARMFPEARILTREQSLNEQRRDGRKRYYQTIFTTEMAVELSVCIIDRRSFRQVINLRQIELRRAPFIALVQDDPRNRGAEQRQREQRCAPAQEI